MIRPPRSPLFVAAGFVVALGLAGCGGENPYDAARNAGDAPVTTVVADIGNGDTLANNDFLPEGQNVSDCVGTVERPNCGSSSKGGWRMTLVFIVLIGGLGFIGWRIALQIRARDAVVNRIDD